MITCGGWFPFPACPTPHRRRRFQTISQDVWNASPILRNTRSLCGQCALEGDSLGRTVVYGLVRGKGAGTVVLTGHYDVVDTDEYGRFRALAYDMEAWKHIHGEELEALKSMLPQEARDDLASGEWLFGRGVNDMKGGLSIGLAIMDWFGQKVLEYPETTGNLLFAAVADEEAYSAGMRGAVSLFTGLRQEYGLTYDCLVDLEPSFNEGGKQQVYIGSVGKTMPAVLGTGRQGACGGMLSRTEFHRRAGGDVYGHGIGA